jgi:hypothetical protein
MRLAALLFVIALSGCESLQYAGIARYEIGPLTNAAGDPVGCCVLRIWNGKEMAAVDAQFARTGDGNYSISLKETDVKAFTGQATAAAAASDAVAAATSAAVTAIKTLQ